MARQPVPERVQLVRILLASFYDYLPDPATSTGLISRSASPGPAPGKRVPCSYCRRTGRIRLRSGSRFCPVCEGLGWRRRRLLPPSHPQYEEPWDEMVEEPVREEEQQNPHSMPSEIIDLQLDRLQHEAELREGITDSERFGWEGERRLYQRQGSYVQLGLALGSLQLRWPPGHQAIRRTYMRGIEIVPNSTVILLVDVAEEWLAREMRGHIRVPKWLQEEQADRKQETIADLATQGLTPGQIARRLRIPKAKVQRTIRSVTLAA